MVMDMQIRQLEILLAVMHRESFSAAARELELTQPAISMQMKALSREIGTPLFARRGRRTYDATRHRRAHRGDLLSAVRFGKCDGPATGR